MGNRLYSTLAAAVLAASIGYTQPSCTRTQSTVDTGNTGGVVVVEPDRRKQVRMALEDIARSTHCVRTVSEYRRRGAPDSEPIKTRRSHGTAFAYGHDGEETKLVTNVHVIEDPDVWEVIQLKLNKTDMMLSFEKVLYDRLNTRSYLVDNGADDDHTDDIPVELVDGDEDLDIQTIRVAKTLHVADRYVREPDFSPEFGDEVYIVGYPQAWELTVTKGIISNPEHEGRDGNEYQLLDAAATFGNSGGTYWIERDGELYWGGVTGKVRLYGRSCVTFMTMGTPLKTFDPMLEGNPVINRIMRNRIRVFLDDLPDLDGIGDDAGAIRDKFERLGGGL